MDSSVPSLAPRPEELLTMIVGLADTEVGNPDVLDVLDVLDVAFLVLEVGTVLHDA